MVATTSISPLTRSAGNPTAQAIAPATSAATSERRDERPLREHGQHAGDVGADREEAGLGEAHLAGQQHAIGREPEQGVDADDLSKAEIEIHRAARRQSRPAARREHAARPEHQEHEQQQHDVEVALGHAAEELEDVLQAADQQPAMMAPGMLPRPPITVTISPLTVSGSDSSGESMPIAAPIMAPAMPPSTPVMTKVRLFTRGDADAAQLRRGRLLRDRARREPEPGAVEQREQHAPCTAQPSANTNIRSPRRLNGPARMITSENSAG